VNLLRVHGRVVDKEMFSVNPRLDFRLTRRGDESGLIAANSLLE
jgi:hypothetical protein